jgi:MFS family permease
MHERPGLAHSVVVVIGLAVLLNYLDRGNLATAAPVLQDELGLSSAQVGVLLSSFFWAYAPAQLLAGWLVHRYDMRGASATRVRKTFVLAGGLGTAVTISTCSVVEPRHAVPLLAVAGVFFGLSTPMIFAIAATLAGPRAAGRWAGAQNLGGQLAGVVAPLVTGMLVDRTGTFGWAFAAAAASGIVAMLAWGLVVGRIEPTPWPDGYRSVLPAVAVVPE